MINDNDNDNNKNDYNNDDDNDIDNDNNNNYNNDDCGWRQPKQNKQTRNETSTGVSQQVRSGTILRVGKTRKPRKTKGDG